MNYSVFIRPLEVNDAKISYKWRNDKVIWIYTEFKPDKQITEEIETAWLKNALLVKNDYRFAICIKETGEYIGNVQFLSLKNKCADLHLFIGESKYWGRGIGKEAIKLLLDYGFDVLNLCNVLLKVHHKHIAAQNLYKKMGFQIINDKGVFIKMILTKKYYKALLRIQGADFLNAPKAV